MAALALAGDVEAALRCVAAAPPNATPLREAGLKGLFEASRGDAWHLSCPYRAGAVAEVCKKLLKEDPCAAVGGPLQGLVALLFGLCGDESVEAENG